MSWRRTVTIRLRLVTLLVFGVGFFTGNRLVGRLTDRSGSLPTLTGALIGTICADAALTAVQHWFLPTLVAFFALGVIGSFLFIPQQNRVFVAGGDLAAVALGLNGSMNYVGTAIGAALGGVVLSIAGVLWLGPAATLIATIVLASRKRGCIAATPARSPRCSHPNTQGRPRWL